jgi:hypothetical protein
MTGATIAEARNQFALDATRYFRHGLASLQLVHSTEDDYESTGIVVSGQWEFDDALGVLGVSASYSDDTLEPTDAAFYGRVKYAKRRSHSLATTFSRIVNRDTVVQGGVSVTRHGGFLSDPYKLRDVRPDKRIEWTATLKFRRFVEAANAAWHVDYRFYGDDWGVRAHTLDSAWYQSLGGGLQLVPNVRWYAQREADFFLFIDDYTLSPAASQSSDHRLASFGAVSGGVKLTYAHDRWSVSLSVDRYVSGEKYGFDDAPFDHPATLDYTMATLSWDIRL